MSAAAPLQREEMLAEKLEHFLSTIVSAIARSTKSPKIEHYPNQALFTLSVDPGDQARFIGKHGATIWGIQTIFWFAGLAQFGYSYSVKLLGPAEKPPRRVSPPLRFNPKWARQTINNLISEILGACLPAHANYLIKEVDETNAVVQLTLPKYLQMQLNDPNFPEAVATVLKTAGMTQGCSIRTETVFQ